MSTGTVDVILAEDCLHTHTHYFKGFENEEMILIKEVMANTHAQTNTHTHTPFSSHFLVLWHRLTPWGKFLLPGVCFDSVFNMLL